MIHNRSNESNPSSCTVRQKSVRMIEFFSGIGGMRLGVQDAIKKHSSSSSVLFKSCHAFEISNHANEVYRYNFDQNESISKEFTVQTKLVEQLKPKDLDGKADLWTMSPPCQPFTSTRLAKQLDSDDKRCNGLKGIISILNNIQKKPKWILLENVKGFIGSKMLQEWYHCLETNGYSWQEYVLCPTQLGIPNCRKRYYMICERSKRFPSEKRSLDDISLSSLSLLLSPEGKRNCIQDYIMKQESTDTWQSVILQDSIFEREWVTDLGIVTPRDTITHCFTAAYARQLHKATGSVLLMDGHDQNLSEIDRSNMQQYKKRIRRFLPCELLRLFGFPDYFKFPKNMSLEQQYKLIGNSVNVNVVAYVAGILLFHTDF